MPWNDPLVGKPTFNETGDALARLITAARGTSGGERRVASFLLNWWDGQAGLISMADLCYVDAETREDILVVIAFLARNGVHYADAWGRRGDIQKLMD